MSNHYWVTAVRKSKGVFTDEGRYPDEAAAIVRLARRESGLLNCGSN